MTEARIAIIETDVKYTRKAVDEINDRLRDGDSTNKEMLQLINENRSDINLLKQNCENFEKKITVTQGRVELVEDKVNIHDNILSSVSKEQDMRGKWQDKILSEFVRIGLTGGVIAAAFKALAVLKVAV